MINHEDSNIVPIFQSYDDVLRDHAQILAEFNDELDTIEKAYNLTWAALNADADALGKAGAGDRDLAKASAARLLVACRDNMSLAKGQATVDGLTALRDALLKRNARLFGVGEVAKRSLRFAMAAPRKYHAPATVLKIERKQ